VQVFLHWNRRVFLVQTPLPIPCFSGVKQLILILYIASNAMNISYIYLPTYVFSSGVEHPVPWYFVFKFRIIRGIWIPHVETTIVIKRWYVVWLKWTDILIFKA
jgi:hypothetical protein